MANNIALATVVPSERECVRIKPVADGDLERQEGVRDGERFDMGNSGIMRLFLVCWTPPSSQRFLTHRRMRLPKLSKC